MIKMLAVAISFASLLAIVHSGSIDMGSCRMECENPVPGSPAGIAQGRPGKKGPQGEKGDTGNVGQKGNKGEPAEECLCPEHNALQEHIDNVLEKVRKIHAPENCSDVILRKETHRGGAFRIYPEAFGDAGIEVYCDAQTDDGGWLVFQRRMDGSVDFFRTWNDYENGFGDVNGEFWLGLKNIYKLIQDGQYELRVDLEDFEGNATFAKYSNFQLGGADTFYNATTSGYSGSAGNCLTLTNVPFSTKDQDHDSWSKNCADGYKGAMWYTSCHCAHLNGLYLKGQHDSYANGVNWKHWKGFHYSLKFTEMKIRKLGSVFDSV